MAKYGHLPCSMAGRDHVIFIPRDANDVASGPRGRGWQLPPPCALSGSWRVVND